MILSLGQVLKTTGGKLLQGGGETFFQGISTDSRTVAEGNLFIALKGARFDGHRFALEALEKKAAGVVLEEGESCGLRWNGYRSRVVIAVKDTLRALGDLACDQRRQYGIPVVAVTGSNGKTTTKEMIAACLETTGPVLKSEGNWNNLIGLPLTLFRLTEKERVAVLEMGMNVPGEIRRLCEIAEPDVALITNIESVHLEGLGSLERLTQEKGELFRRMRKDGRIVVNADDPRVVGLAETFPGSKMTFGIKRPAEVMAREIRLRGIEGTSFTLIARDGPLDFKLPVLGRHFVLNALAAIAVGYLFGVDAKKSKEALEHFAPSPMRMEIRPLADRGTLINDTYNANPKSMELALETLAEVKGKGRAIAVLGDMLELGRLTDDAHQALGRKVKELSIDFLLALGKEAPVVVESAVRHGLDPERAKVAGTHSEAISILKAMTQEGDWILVKGSRGMALETIVDGLIEGRA